MELSRTYCASVDHAYTQVTLVWCPHEQAWSLLWSHWLDTGRDDLDSLRSGRIDLGPFDDVRDATKLATVKLVELLERLPR